MELLHVLPRLLPPYLFVNFSGLHPPTRIDLDYFKFEPTSYKAIFQSKLFIAETFLNQPSLYGFLVSVLYPYLLLYTQFTR